MKKRLLPLLLSTTAFALPVGNPIDSSLYSEGLFFEDLLFCYASVRGGFYGDYVFNRHLEIDAPDNHSDVPKTTLFTNAGYIAVDFFERFDAFFTLGATNLEAQAHRHQLGTSLSNSNIMHIVTDTAFSWSAGARATVLDWCGVGFGIEWQYFRTTPKLKKVYNGSEGPFYPVELEAKYREWQIGFGPTYTVELVEDALWVVPYAAAKWANCKLNLGDFIQLDEGRTNTEFRLFNMENERNWGWAFGMTLLGDRKWTLTGEVRFVDETAAHVNTQFRF